MTEKDEVNDQEEMIREMVRELPNDKKKLFHQRSEKSLKDPDTYAALNFVFIAGLHHFYLGKWVLGFSIIFLFWFGLILLFSEYLILGLILIALTFIIELNELFRAQIIIQKHNNRVMENIFHNLH
jgi:TM2 domain-containing membrane protein YozV